MEKLKCGRFIPREDTDNAARLRALETHLAALSEEMEYLILEIVIVSYYFFLFSCLFV